MNQIVFASKNILDKLIKIFKSPEIFKFYLDTYILSSFEGVDPNVYIVSYPKCGRTWLRVMLQRYLAHTGTTVRTFKDPSNMSLSKDTVVKFEHDQGNWVPAPPKLGSLSFNAEKYSEKKVVFLVRDPRDALVSSWYHLKYRERIFSGSFSAFIRDDLVGIKKIVGFMNLWIENRETPSDFLLLTYEQLHSDPLGNFRTLLEFIGIHIDQSALQQAVDESRFDKMKKMEVNGKFDDPWMKPGGKDMDKTMKIRKGKVGSYRDELSDEDIRYLDEYIQSHLSPFISYTDEAKIVGNKMV